MCLKKWTREIPFLVRVFRFHWNAWNMRISLEMRELVTETCAFHRSYLISFSHYFRWVEISCFCAFKKVKWMHFDLKYAHVTNFKLKCVHFTEINFWASTLLSKDQKMNKAYRLYCVQIWWPISSKPTVLHFLWCNFHNLNIKVVFFSIVFLLNSAECSPCSCLTILVLR